MWDLISFWLRATDYDGYRSALSIHVHYAFIIIIIIINLQTQREFVRRVATAREKDYGKTTARVGAMSSLVNPLSEVWTV